MAGKFAEFRKFIGESHLNLENNEKPIGIEKMLEKIVKFSASSRKTVRISKSMLNLNC